MIRITCFVLLWIPTSTVDLQDAVTCDFEQDFCGWSSIKTLVKQDGLVCGIRKEWSGCSGKRACKYPRGSCERIEYYRNHIKWERKTSKGNPGFHDGMVLITKHSQNKRLKGTNQISDIESPEIPISFRTRCLHYRFKVTGGLTLIVAYTSEKYNYADSNMQIMGYHKADYSYTNSRSRHQNRGLVHLPIARRYKIIIRVIYQRRHRGGSAMIDDLYYTNGKCQDTCTFGQFRCHDGDCINSSKVCNFIKDCIDGSDEKECHTRKHDVKLRSCKTSQSVMLSKNCRSPVIIQPEIKTKDKVCYQLIPAANETTCRNKQCTAKQHEHCYLKCPHTCKCEGLSFKCSTPSVPEVARSIDVSGVKIHGHKFKLDHFFFLVNLKMDGCGISKFNIRNHLRNLQTLDLSNNNIQTLDGANIKNLIIFKIDGNPIHSSTWMKSIGNITFIQLRNSTLQPPVLDLGKNLNDIDFSNNKLENTEIRSDSYHPLLNFSNCRIASLQKWNISSKILDMSFNSIKTFIVHKRLNMLLLQNNQLREFIRPYNSSQVVYLGYINVANNKIDKLEKHSMQHFPRLDYLDLKGNRISSIDHNVFSYQSKLVYLDLSYNSIQRISRKGFAGLDNLRLLFIQGNTIKKLDGYIFSSLRGLQHLDMSSNSIHTIKPNSFSGLTSLQNLSLQHNVFRVRRHLFQGLLVLNNLYVDDYTICCAKPPTVPKEGCTAPMNSISSCEQLIDVPILGVCIWYMAFLAIFGNSCVIIYRIITWKKSSTKTQAILTGNLSIADFLMGIYLYIMAGANLHYTGEYGFADFDWRNGWVCQLAGILATLSSEASVLIVFAITVDRLTAIKFGMFGKKITVNQCIVLISIVWMISLLISLVPALERTYFKSFYSSSGICISLPLSVKRKPGWQFSMAIFIGLNFLLFLGILIGQMIIFYEVAKTGRKSGFTWTKEREISVAKTLFAVVLTDMLCWIPIGIIGLLTFGGINISSQIYAWIVVLVLPLNSALNPLLYTFVAVLRRKVCSGNESVKITSSSLENKREVRINKKHKIEDSQEELKMCSYKSLNEIEKRQEKIERKVEGKKKSESGRISVKYKRSDKESSEIIEIVEKAV